MAEQRALLLDIYKLLNVSTDDDQTIPNSDVALLETILARVKSLNTSQAQADSLAFPQDVREKIDLPYATELWAELEGINDSLRQDYMCRRKMLLTRLDCTVESFKWKGTAPGQPDKTQHGPRAGGVQSINDQIHGLYDKARATIKEDPQISISNLLAIRDKDCDKLLNEVVSTKTVDCSINYGTKGQLVDREKIKLKRVIIPDVPDRGGRTDEIRQQVRETFDRPRRGRCRR